MKKIYFMSALVLALGLAGCTNTELDPLTGVFPSPTETVLSQETTTATINVYKDDRDRRIFDLELSGSGTSLKATLVGDKYFLTANQYSEALDAVAQKGNYILGKTSINGQAVKQGTITVELLSQTDTEEGCDNTYAISTVLFLEDGTPYKISWTGNFAFEKDAEVGIDGYYTDTVSAAQDASWATIEGVEKHTLLIVDEEGNTLASAELVIAVGGKLDGDYTCMSYPDKDHYCGNGYDLSAYGWGIGGTYYVSDGAYILVNEGEKISVSDLGNGIYTITYPDGFALTAAPEGYTPGAVTLNTVMSVTNYYELYAAYMEIHLIGLELSDGKVTSSFDATTYQTTYSGEGDFLKLEFYTADGKVAPGTYKACAVGGEVGEGEFGIGYTGQYGPGSGTNWVHSAAGANTFEPVLDGELTISYADGKFTFTLVSDVVTATYTGPVEGLSVAGEDPGPGPGPGPEDEVTLTDFLSFTSYKQYNINLAGAELATSGFSYTADFDWTTFTTTYTFSGDGSFIKLELYTEGDSFAPGTYTPSADPNNVAAGEFKTGSAAGGTTWNVVKDNEITSTYVTDGTVNVSVEGDVYTIEVNSTAVNAKYVGKLSK